MSDELSDSKIAESANASAIATEAQHNAIREIIRTTLTDGLRQVLVEDDENSPILVKSKIKRICDSQEKQAIDIRDIKNTLWWMSRIASVVGLSTLTLVAALIAALRIHV